MTQQHFLKNKTVFITGASSGIGKACAEAFAKAGCHLVLCARRVERLAELAEQLHQAYQIKVHYFNLDVRDGVAVRQMIAAIPEALKPIHILINNAGLAKGLSPLQEGSLDDWETMIDTNIKGLLYVTQAVMPEMLQHHQGHIINIGSNAGREVYAKGNVYCATKHAVRALSQALRLDLNGKNIRVTEIQPGLVYTEFSQVRFDGDMQQAERPYEGMQPLAAEDIADAALYAASCPAHVNISEILIQPVAQANASTVYREKNPED